MNSPQDLALDLNARRSNDAAYSDFLWEGCIGLVEQLHSQYNAQPHTWSKAVIKAGHRQQPGKTGLDITHVLHERPVLVHSDTDLKKPLAERALTLYVNTKPLSAQTTLLPAQEYLADRVQFLVSSRFTADLSLPEAEARAILDEYLRELADGIDERGFGRGRTCHMTGTIDKAVVVRDGTWRYRPTVYTLFSTPYHSLLQDEARRDAAKGGRPLDDVLLNEDFAKLLLLSREQRRTLPLRDVVSERYRPVARGLALPGGWDAIGSWTVGQLTEAHARHGFSDLALIALLHKQQAVRDFLFRGFGGLLEVHEDLELPAYERAVRRA